VRLLLDTHSILWFAAGTAALSATARAQVADSHNELWASHASDWEMAIKTSLDKLRLDRELPAWLERLDHVVRVSRLPREHGDPFDRLLVAQCAAERLAIVSRDPVFDAYGIKRVW
jgi:PIN domain nuclease of toxin-antitoxin system